MLVRVFTFLKAHTSIWNSLFF